MRYPNFIRKGDCIGVTAPSGGNESQTDLIRLEHAKEKLAALGFLVTETENVRMSDGMGRSSSAVQRKEELERLWRDPKVSSIVFAKGGDYLCEMLSLLDFSILTEHPVWMQGYSDSTGILFTAATMCDIASIYGGHFNEFGMECWHESVISNLELLKGNLVEQCSFDYFENDFHDRVTGLEGYAKDQKVCWKHNQAAEEITVKGRLIGGCLDVLLMLCGTRFDYVKDFISRYEKEGILWYLESFETSTEQIQIGLWELKEAGWLEGASGIIFGRPCMYRTFTDTPYQEAVERALSGSGLPLIFDADIGHRGPQFTLINGSYATVSCGRGKGRLRMELR